MNKHPVSGLPGAPVRRRLARLCALGLASAMALSLGGGLVAEGAAADGARQGSNLLADLQFEPIRFRRPAVERMALQHGALLIRAPENTLPFFTLSLQFPNGTSAEPIANAGLWSASLSLLDRGGAGELSGEDRSRLLGKLGGSLSFSTDYEYWDVTLRFLKQDYAVAMQLLRAALLEPRLPEDELADVKNALLAGIERRNDTPDPIASRKLNEILYPGLRRGYALSPEDVARLNTGAIRAELQRRLSARGVIVTLAGDFAGLPVEADLNQLLSAFPAAAPPPAEAAGYEALRRARRANDPYRGKIVVARTPASQAVIAIGGYLPERNNAAFFPLQTGNFALGGGSFNSRFMREIRAERGLAYYAYSYNDFSREDGAFIAGAGTRSQQAHETLALMLQIIGDMRRGVSAGELSLAQDSILNGLAFQFDSPEDVAANEARFTRLGLPENYIETFPASIRAVTSPQIGQAAARYLNPDDLYIVVAGPDALAERLKAIRPVVVVEPEEKL